MRQQIEEQYKTALKAGDKRRTATLRSINAALKDKDIEARGQGKGLPKAMNEAEVDEAIRSAIATTGASGAKDMGKVIASLKADYPGRIDFGKASAKVKAALG